METITEALTLLKRQVAIENELGRPGGSRANAESELYSLRQRLQRYPHAVAAILQTASNLHRPLDTLSPEDVRQTA